MTERFPGLAGMSIVMEDVAVVSHERGCSTLPLVLREMTLLANCGAVVTAVLLSLAIDGSRSWQNVVGILFEASVGGAMLAARL
jgi:hypothetical protein